MNLLKSLATAGFIGFLAVLPMSAEEHLKSLDPKQFDPNTPASADFYQHVTKGWRDAHPLTAEHARYGALTYSTILPEARVKRIVLGLGATNPKRVQWPTRYGHFTPRLWILCVATVRVPPYSG